MSCELLQLHFCALGADHPLGKGEGQKGEEVTEKGKRRRTSGHPLPEATFDVVIS
jgi:hypothetical protein